MLTTLAAGSGQRTAGRGCRMQFAVHSFQFLLSAFALSAFSCHGLNFTDYGSSSGRGSSKLLPLKGFVLMSLAACNTTPNRPHLLSTVHLIDASVKTVAVYLCILFFLAVFLLTRPKLGKTICISLQLTRRGACKAARKRERERGAREGTA